MGLYCDLVRLPAAAVEGCGRLRADEAALVRHIQESATGWVEIDKAWHGVHVLLNPGYPRAEFPLGFLFAGGELLSDRDWSEAYGVAVPDLRVFTVAEVRAIGEALAGVGERELLRRYDSERLWRFEVYPRIWERRGEWVSWVLARYFGVSVPGRYLATQYGVLRGVVGEAVAAREGLVVKYHQ